MADKRGLGMSERESGSRGGPFGLAAPLVTVALLLWAALPASAATVVINISATAPFGTTTIDWGDTVTWTNTHGITHNAIADGGRWNTGNFASGSRSVTFNQVGDSGATYPYTCTLHPSQMTGTIIVRPRPPTIALNTTSIVRTSTEGQNAAAASFTVRNSAAGSTLNYSITDTNTDPIDWISVSPTGGTSTGETDTINVNFATSALAAGSYSGTITVSGTGATNTPRTISVSLTVDPLVVIPGTWVADFREELDLFNAGAGPRVLQALSRVAGAGPELTEGDEVENPTPWGGSLEVDLDPTALTLDLTATANACYGYITLEIDEIQLPNPDSWISAVNLVSTGAFSNEGAPDFERKLSFGPNSIVVHYEFTDGSSCGLSLSNGQSDRYEIVVESPVPLMADFREELDILTRGSGPRVLEALDAPIGAGNELDEGDEIENPTPWGGALEVDFDPAAMVLNLTGTTGACYDIITVDITDIEFQDPSRRVTDLVLLSTGAFSSEADPNFERTVSIAEDSIHLEFKVEPNDCDLLIAAGGVDQYQILTAATPVPTQADFREQLELFNVGSGPRILEALDRQIGDGVELDETDQLQNPSGWADSLIVDFDPKSLILNLTPTSSNCYGYITVTLEDLRFPLPGQEIAGVDLISRGAFENEGDPDFFRTVSFTSDSVTIDYRVTTGNCSLSLSNTGQDRYRIFTQGPVSICGNDAIEFPETCDDGNVAGGDCCSATCALDPPGAFCTDDDECTDDDTCDGQGVCDAGPPLVCDDAQFCNGLESCDTAIGCVAGTPPVIDDGVSCTDDSCDELADQVVNVVNDGRCNNGAFCDGLEFCDATLDCQAGAPPVVDDGVACTDDSCDEVADVVLNAPNDSLCDNGAFCDGFERCDAKLDCQVGTPPTVDDGIACTDDSCDEAADLVRNDVNDALCDNALFCDGLEFCSPTLDCQAGAPPVVDDGVACTDDFCDEEADEVLNLVNDAFCDNGVLCDGTETCDAALDCQPGESLAATAIEDFEGYALQSDGTGTLVSALGETFYRVTSGTGQVVATVVSDSPAETGVGEDAVDRYWTVDATTSGGLVARAEIPPDPETGFASGGALADALSPPRDLVSPETLVCADVRVAQANRETRLRFLMRDADGNLAGSSSESILTDEFATYELRMGDPLLLFGGSGFDKTRVEGLGFDFSTDADGSEDFAFDIDNVRLAVIPEPGGAAAALAAALALAVLVRRRRSS